MSLSSTRAINTFLSHCRIIFDKITCLHNYSWEARNKPQWGRSHGVSFVMSIKTAAIIHLKGNNNSAICVSKMMYEYDFANILY